MMFLTPWRLLFAALAITVAVTVAAYLQTPRGLPILIAMFCSWCGGMVIEAILRKWQEAGT